MGFSKEPREHKVLKWYCKKCIQYKSVFKLNEYEKKTCMECGEELIVKEMAI